MGWGGVAQTLALLGSRVLGSAERGFVVQLLYEGLLCLGYLAYAVLPPALLPRRPAMTGYSIFWSVFRPIQIATLLLIFYGYDAGYCIYLAGTWALFGVLRPVVMYRALLQDARYWQGLGAPSAAAAKPADIRTVRPPPPRQRKGHTVYAFHSYVGGVGLHARAAVVGDVAGSGHRAGACRKHGRAVRLLRDDQLRQFDAG